MDFAPIPLGQRLKQLLPFLIRLEVPALPVDLDASDLQSASKPGLNVRPASLRISSEQPRRFCPESADCAGIGDDVIGRETAHPREILDGRTQFSLFPQRYFFPIRDQLGE